MDRIPAILLREVYFIPMSFPQKMLFHLLLVPNHIVPSTCHLIIRDVRNANPDTSSQALDPAHLKVSLMASISTVLAREDPTAVTSVWQAGVLEL